MLKGKKVKADGKTRTAKLVSAKPVLSMCSFADLSAYRYELSRKIEHHRYERDTAVVNGNEPRANTQSSQIRLLTISLNLVEAEISKALELQFEVLPFKAVE